MTKVFVEEFKGNKTFAVWNVDTDGNKVGNYPIISFGAKKAKALFEHFDDLEEFVEDMEN